MAGPFFGRTRNPLRKKIDNDLPWSTPYGPTCASRVYSKRVRGVAIKNEDIPALIRKLRQRLNLTQEQFAQKVGVTYSTVNHWENGKLAETRQKLLEHFDEDVHSRLRVNLEGARQQLAGC
jgi:DNA-binding XRE family transcriptional regulator